MIYILNLNWSSSYTPALKGQVFYDDIVEVLVTKKIEKDESIRYICTRKELVPDPWSDIKLNDYNKGDLVRVQCITKRANYWFGRIKGIENLPVFTEYPSSECNITIIEGMEYMGDLSNRH